MQATKKVNVFPEADIEAIQKNLGRINNIIAISWKFVPGRLEVTGILDDDELLTFTHSKSALAYLDGFLEGYNLGFGDGREGNDFDVD